MFFYTRRLLSIMLLILVGSLGSAQLNTSTTWKLVLDKNDIKVFTKPSRNGISFYMTETIIQTSIQELYDFFTDFSLYTKWVNNCTLVNLLTHTPDSVYTYYTYFDMPWPAANRDAVSDLRVIEKSSDKILVQSIPSQRKVPKKEKTIRVTNFEENYSLTEISENKTLLVMQGAYDPGGVVPDWLVRKLLKYGPYDVIMKIRQHVE